MERGRRRVLYRGATLFTQETPNDGIWLIETGRIRVFYAAPTGREITLAYWYPGNFVGGPEVFGAGTHSWSGMAASNSTVLHLPGAALKQLVARIPSLAFGIIDGLTFKGRCYSALAQMLGTRSITDRLVLPLDPPVEPLRRRGGGRRADRRRLHPCGPRPHGGRHPAMGDDQPEAPVRAGRGDDAPLADPDSAPDILARMPGGDEAA